MVSAICGGGQFGIAADGAERHVGGGVAPVQALLPIVHCGADEAETLGEGGATVAMALADGARNWRAGWPVHNHTGYVCWL